MKTAKIGPLEIFPLYSIQHNHNVLSLSPFPYTYHVQFASEAA